MREETLFAAIGGAEEALLTRAEKPHRRRGRRWAAMAASLALLAIGGAALLRFGGGMGANAGGGSGDEVTGDGSREFMSYAGPVLPLTAVGGAAGVEAVREITYDFAPYIPVEESYEDSRGETVYYDAWDSSADVTDSYTLTNTTGEEVTLSLLYPYMSTMEAEPPTVLVNGERAELTPYYGDYVGQFVGAWGANHENETLNLQGLKSWEGVQALLESGAYRQAALGRDTVVLDQPVVVYAFTDAVAPAVEDGAPTLAMEFTMDYDKTTVLTYGFNGSSRDSETGYRRCSFFVEEPGSKWADQPRFVAIVGEDIESYTLTGYEDGGCDAGEELPGVTAKVTRYETDLGTLIDALLREADFDFRYETVHGDSIPTIFPREAYINAIAEALVQYGPLAPESMMRYDMGDLESVCFEATGYTRVLYVGFTVTIPAGESAVVEARLNRDASMDFVGSGKDAHGFDMMTRLDSSLNFTAQRAAAIHYDAVELVANNFGFDFAGGVDAVELDLSVPHYYMEVRWVGLADAEE